MQHYEKRFFVAKEKGVCTHKWHCSLGIALLTCMPLTRKGGLHAMNDLAEQVNMWCALRKGLGWGLLAWLAGHSIPRGVAQLPLTLCGGAHLTAADRFTGAQRRRANGRKSCSPAMIWMRCMRVQRLLMRSCRTLQTSLPTLTSQRITWCPF